MTQVDEYAGWRALLRGDKIDVDPNEPFSGFYRTRLAKGGQYVPVAYWREGGNLVCVIDGRAQDEDRAVERWPYCVRSPISHEVYIAFTERGEGWPDMDATVQAQLKPPAPGHNQGPTDDLTTLAEQIEAAAAGVSEYQSIDSDEKQAKAQSLRARLNELAGAADKKREAEKKPHLEAGKAIDTKWKPLVNTAKAAADIVAKAMSAWETVKFNKAKAQALADARAREKAEAEGRPAPQPAAPPSVAPAPIKGAYGRAASVKLVKVATVENQDAVYAYMRERPEVIECLAKLAQRAVDAGLDVPGVKVSEERKVA